MNWLIVAGSLVATLLLGACANSEQTLGGYDKTVIGAGTGAVLGGVAGAVLDKKHRGRGAAVGAAAGAAVGGGVGYLFDRQEDEFRAALAQQASMHQAEVERLRDDLLKITIQNEVMFDFGKADLKPAFDGTIDKLAEVLKKYDRSAATIFGYTDSVGIRGLQSAALGAACRCGDGGAGRPRRARQPDECCRPRRGRPARRQRHRGWPPAQPPRRDPGQPPGLGARLGFRAVSRRTVAGPRSRARKRRHDPEPRVRRGGGFQTGPRAAGHDRRIMPWSRSA